MSKAIILGDPHIGKGASALGKSDALLLSNSKIQDQFNLLHWVSDYAINNHCSHIIITGDLFEDPKPNQELIVELIKWLRSCSINNIEIHIIFGNHDFFRFGNFYTSPLDIINEAEIPNVYVYNSFTNIYLGNCGITIAPFRDKKSYFVQTPIEALHKIKSTLDYQRIEIPNSMVKICIGHLALEGSIPVGDEFDDLLNELIVPLDYFEGYDAVWMGHVHTPQVLSKKPLISHVGSMDISNFGESEHIKNIVVFNYDNFSHETVVIPTKKLHKISISIPENIEDGTEYVKDYISKLDLKNQIIKVEIESNSVGTKSTDKKQIEKMLEANGVRSVSSITESKKLNLVKKKNTNISAGISVKESIVEYSKTLPDSIRNEATSIMIELFNSLEK